MLLALRTIIPIPVTVSQVLITAISRLVLSQLLLSLALSFFLLLFLQSLYNPVYSSITFLLRAFCEMLQRILKLNSLSIRNQLIQDFRTVRELFIVRTILVEQSYSLPVASLGIAELLLSPIKVSKV